MTWNEIKSHDIKWHSINEMKRKEMKCHEMEGKEQSLTPSKMPSCQQFRLLGIKGVTRHILTRLCTAFLIKWCCSEFETARFHFAILAQFCTERRGYVDLVSIHMYNQSPRKQQLPPRCFLLSSSSEVPPRWEGNPRKRPNKNIKNMFPIQNMFWLSCFPKWWILHHLEESNLKIPSPPPKKKNDLPANVQGRQSPGRSYRNIALQWSLHSWRRKGSSPKRNRCQGECQKQYGTCMMIAC